MQRLLDSGNSRIPVFFRPPQFPGANEAGQPFQVDPPLSSQPHCDGGHNTGGGASDPTTGIGRFVYCVGGEHTERGGDRFVFFPTSRSFLSPASLLIEREFFFISNQILNDLVVFVMIFGQKMDVL